MGARLTRVGRGQRAGAGATRTAHTGRRRVLVSGDGGRETGEGHLGEDWVLLCAHVGRPARGGGGVVTRGWAGLLFSWGRDRFGLK